jgi:hypothetical protein
MEALSPPKRWFLQEPRGITSHLHYTLDWLYKPVARPGLTGPVNLVLLSLGLGPTHTLAGPSCGVATLSKGNEDTLSVPC